MADRIVNIDIVRRRSAGTITYNERQHAVQQITQGALQALNASVSDGEVYTDRLFRVTRECVPSFTDEDAKLLTVDAANAIIALAGGGIAAVESMFPNALRPENDSTTSPG